MKKLAMETILREFIRNASFYDSRLTEAEQEEGQLEPAILKAIAFVKSKQEDIIAVAEIIENFDTGAGFIGSEEGELGESDKVEKLISEVAKYDIDADTGKAYATIFLAAALAEANFNNIPYTLSAIQGALADAFIAVGRTVGKVLEARITKLGDIGRGFRIKPKLADDAVLATGKILNSTPIEVRNKLKGGEFELDAGSFKPLTRAADGTFTINSSGSPQKFSAAVKSSLFDAHIAKPAEYKASTDLIRHMDASGTPFTIANLNTKAAQLEADLTAKQAQARASGVPIESLNPLDPTGAIASDAKRIAAEMGDDITKLVDDPDYLMSIVRSYVKSKSTFAGKVPARFRGAAPETRRGAAGTLAGFLTAVIGIGDLTRPTLRDVFTVTNDQMKSLAAHLDRLSEILEDRGNSIAAGDVIKIQIAAESGSSATSALSSLVADLTP